MCFGGGGRQSQKAQKEAQKQQQQMYDQQRAEAAAAEARARAEAQRRANNLSAGMANIDKAYSGFNDAYYNKIGDEYSTYYMPQLQKQAEEARQKMLFNAARAGTVNSAQYGKNLAGLDESMALRQNEINSQANSRMNEARADIARQRSAQVAALNASQGDLAGNSPFLSGNLSVNAPVLAPFSPLGDLFGGLSGLAANDARIANAQGQEGFVQSGVKRLVGGESKYVR